MSKIKVSLLQLKTCQDPTTNLQNALENIIEAKKNGSQLICLPECFNSPYGTEFFKDYAETISGPTCQMLSKASKEHSVYIVGGTFPEHYDGKYFNTCTVWNPKGELIAKYRKIHLFDVDIPGKITFRESDVLCGGGNLETFEIDGVRIGIGICHDIRFEELAKLYRKKGCHVLIYPGAFEMITGQLHWELLQRTRALDNQVYVLAVSPARNNSGYISWSHSQITDPWGKIIAQAGFGEEVICGVIDITECEEVRRQIPIFDQRRDDLYDTVLIKKSVQI